MRGEQLRRAEQSRLRLKIARDQQEMPRFDAELLREPRHSQPMRTLLSRRTNGSDPTSTLS